MKKGISLVALVVTIIVLIILTGAVILTFQDGGIIDRADQAVEDSNDAVLEEKITMMNLEYTQKLKKKFTPKTRETLKAIVKQSGIDLDKLLVYYEPTDGEQLVFYKIDKVTKDEVEWFINNTVKVEIDGTVEEMTIWQLIGDVNLDGDFTQEDYDLMYEYGVGLKDLPELPRDNYDWVCVVGDLRGNGDIEGNNLGFYKDILEKRYKYKDFLTDGVEVKIENLKYYFGIEI